MTTKECSSKQEKLIAGYLGWKCVPASGARACRPGDISNELWLGECKTHMKPGIRIKFIFKEWLKIYEEATSKFKFPVLFVDDGSQTIENTWCMIAAKTAPVKSVPKEEFRIVAKSSASLDTALINKCDSSRRKMLLLNFNGELVVVMRLSTFKTVC